jgi:hypothetical protein
MKIIKNTTNLTAEEIIAQVTEYQKFFSDFQSPNEESFELAEDGHLVGTSSIYAPIVISNVE